MTKIIGIIAILMLSGIAQADPFKLPLFSETKPGGIAIMPLFDMDMALSEVTNCLPQKSKFQIDIDLVGRASSGDIYDEDELTNLGKYYIGIVAKIPLYSSAEIEDTVRWESNLRIKISDLIGSIAEDITIAKKALIEINMYSALEKRAQKRIEIGVAYTKEQIDYLEKVLTAHSKKNAAIADIHSARLKIISLCTDEKRARVSRYFNRVISNALTQ
jgi:hypothetical protein